LKKYKVALIHNIISPYRVPLFEGLSDNPNIDLSVYFCAKTHGIREWDIIESKKFYYEVLSGVTLEYPGITYHINPIIILKLIQNKFDVVIIGGCTDFTMQAAFVISKIFKIPTILWSEGIENTQSKLGKVINPLTRFIIRKVDTVIVPGTLSRNFHIKQGADSGKIFIAPNIVDIEKFVGKSSKFKEDKEKFKQELNIPNKKIILFIGQLIERKGVEYLINAYTKIREEQNDVCLIIVGNGVLKTKLEEICIEKKIRDVRFTGWVSEEEKIVYYSIANLFVLPTLMDLCPLVLNEAMACGLPVISTDAAGCAVDMIMTDENGFIVNKANANQLYSAIKKIISDDELARRMGNKSLEIIETKYSIDQSVGGFISAIKFTRFNKIK